MEYPPPFKNPDVHLLPNGRQRSASMYHGPPSPTSSCAYTSSDAGVINPMHIITLKAKKTSLGVKLAAKIKSISEQWFSHLLLLVCLCIYASGGAVAFFLLERTSDSDAHVKTSRIKELRDTLMNDLWLKKINSSSREVWIENVEDRILMYEAALKRENFEEVEWTIWSSLFYCGTVLTTIGYGNIAPSTDVGRAVTIVYAFLGIPLMLMVLADLGKLFTKAIKYVFRYLRRFYKLGTFNKKKADAITHSKKPLQYMTVSWRTVSPKSNSEVDAPKNDDFNQVTTLTLHNDDLYKDLDFMNADEPDHKHVEVEDEFNLPVSLAIAMVLLYMVVGALLFTIWEKWTFFESFYFVFISMSTVGFGDFVPSNQTYMMGAFAYLVLGLTLTSMCINVIQEKLSATFQKAKVRIGNTIGLDVNTLLRDEAKRSRQKKLEQKKLRNGVSYEKRASLPNNSVPTVAVSRFESRLPTIDTADNNKKENLLAVPSQHRFKFYDSPYSTIQNESSYNTVSSMSSLPTPSYQMNQS